MLPKGHRNSAGLCGGLEQPRLCLQCTGRDLAGDSSLREGGRTGPELLGRVHQFGERVEGGAHLR